jgi:hypothetical protein
LPHPLLSLPFAPAPAVKLKACAPRPTSILSPGRTAPDAPPGSETGAVARRSNRRDSLQSRPGAPGRVGVQVDDRQSSYLKANDAHPAWDDDSLVRLVLDVADPIKVCTIEQFHLLIVRRIPPRFQKRVGLAHRNLAVRCCVNVFPSPHTAPLRWSKGSQPCGGGHGDGARSCHSPNDEPEPRMRQEDGV